MRDQKKPRSNQSRADGVVVQTVVQQIFCKSTSVLFPLVS